MAGGAAIALKNGESAFQAKLCTMSNRPPEEWGVGLPPSVFTRLQMDNKNTALRTVTCNAVRAGTRTHTVLTGRWTESDFGEGVADPQSCRKWRRLLSASPERIPVGDMIGLSGRWPISGNPVSDQTVGNILRRYGIPPAPKRSRILFPSPDAPLNPKRRTVRCRGRLGGLLRFYSRAA